MSHRLERHRTGTAVRDLLIRIAAGTVRAGADHLDHARASRRRTPGRRPGGARLRRSSVRCCDPLLLAVSKPFGWIGAILLALFANIIVMAVTLWVVPGVIRDGFGWVVLASVLFSIFAALMSWLLVADSDEVFVEQLVRDGKRAAGEVAPSEVPGVVFIQIDGLPGTGARPGDQERHHAHAGPVDPQRLAATTGPSGTCRSPATTPVSQAGLLHGHNDDMPAFRWYEKAAGQAAGGQPSAGRRAHGGPHLRRHGPAGRRRLECVEPVQRRRRAARSW